MQRPKIRPAKLDKRFFEDETHFNKAENFKEVEKPKVAPINEGLAKQAVEETKKAVERSSNDLSKKSLDKKEQTEKKTKEPIITDLPKLSDKNMAVYEYVKQLLRESGRNVNNLVYNVKDNEVEITVGLDNSILNYRTLKKRGTYLLLPERVLVLSSTLRHGKPSKREVERDFVRGFIDSVEDIREVENYIFDNYDKAVDEEPNKKTDDIIVLETEDVLDNVLDTEESLDIEEIKEETLKETTVEPEVKTEADLDEAADLEDTIIEDKKETSNREIIEDDWVESVGDIFFNDFDNSEEADTSKDDDWWDNFDNKATDDLDEDLWFSDTDSFDGLLSSTGIENRKPLEHTLDELFNSEKTEKALKERAPQDKKRRFR